MTELTNTGSAPRRIAIPTMGLVLLVGVSGSGKTTFGARHFGPYEVISSDFCRGLVSNDSNDQSVTRDAFDVLHYIVATRLGRGLLTVVDATNVQPSARASLVKLAKDHDVLVDAIVLDVPESLAAERNRARADRDFGDRVIARQRRDLKQSLRRITKEGFRRVHVLRGEEIDQVEVVREPSWNDRSNLRGPFDIIGDVHGCLGELLSLLAELGWQINYDDEGRAIGAEHPLGRTAVFLGDLVDRGPDTPGVLRLVMGMVDAGTALCVCGNHEAKLARALGKARVQISHGLAESLAQLEQEPPEFIERVRAFLRDLVAYYLLDDARLVVAHAGLKEAYHGRSSARVRAFALYGDTTGESDEFGLPVRYPWAREYRGSAMVVYGHTPVPTTEWVNKTLCIDTGVVFGGCLTALRYPERETVCVPAKQQWATPARPLATHTTRDPAVLTIDDVIGTQWLDTDSVGKVKIPAENAAAALEVMSRFAIDPRWLIYLPPTMAPAPTSQRDGFLEFPEQAFEAFAAAGVDEVICEEKHMGSRAIAVMARDERSARQRFGVTEGIGAIYTRTGRSFFADPGALVDRLRSAADVLFDELNTDWLALDTELLPWSAKALPLIQEQYASVGAAADAGLSAVLDVLDQATQRSLDVADLTTRMRHRQANAAAYRQAYARYVGAASGPDEVTIAPFQVLAAESEVFALTRSHEWHLAQVARMSDPIITPTRNRRVRLDSAAERAEASRWWLDMTDAGGEGMVVKPATPSSSGQPALKVRGREYLRIIYGPDYVDVLPALRGRNLAKKRQLARREYGLGIEALTRFVHGEPLWRVHQMVFAVLALESEPVDPRL